MVLVLFPANQPVQDPSRAIGCIGEVGVEAPGVIIGPAGLEPSRKSIITCISCMLAHGPQV